MALTPGKIRAVMPGASCRTMPPSRRLWNIRSPFVSVYRRDLNPYSNSRSQGGSVRFFVAMFAVDAVIEVDAPDRPGFPLDDFSPERGGRRCRLQPSSRP